MTVLDIDQAMAYTSFVESRHQVWEARQRGLPQPWTTEPIVATRKFTNVFRVLDYGTQFLLEELLDPDLTPRDTLMRCFLYRHTGRVEAWQYLGVTEGYPTVASLPDLLAQWALYRGEGVTKPKGPNTKGGFQPTTYERSVFTGAYLVFPQSPVRGVDKLEAIVDLTRRLFTPGSPQDVVPAFMAATTQAERFAALTEPKGVGNFMGMQTLTDWGYSDQCGVDREDEFVVLGPGALKGAAALDPSAKPYDTFRWAVDAVRSSPYCPTLQTYDLPRVPSYMDVQNTLCEFSKYVRYAKGVNPERVYQPAHPGPQSSPELPGHWS